MAQSEDIMVDQGTDVQIRLECFNTDGSIKQFKRIDPNTGATITPFTATGKIKKSYKAIIQGSLKSNSGEINLPLIHSVKNRKKREVNKKGREAITKYTTLTKSNSHSLLDVDLITGRNHQIRAHLEYLKTPIVNDVLYSAKASPLLDKDTICLQSYELEFVFMFPTHTHPT